MIKVSVVIPVYNVEKYLEKCLNSIINQTLKEIEIICINDCSTDSSFHILKNYQKLDNRIIIINNEINQKAGFSRNIGIEKATGEYIGFIDSDDYIDENFFEELYNTAKKYDSDIVNTANISYHNYTTNKIENTFNSNLIEGTFNYSNDIIIESFRNWFIIKPSINVNVWSKIWKNSFLKNNNIRFFKIFPIEDFNFTLKSLAYEPKISYNNKALYYYAKYDRTSNIPKIQDYFHWDLIMVEDLINYYRKNAPKYVKNIFNVYIGILYASFTELYRKNYNRNDIMLKVSELFNNLNLSYIELKYTNIFLHRFYLIMKNNPNNIAYLIYFYDFIRKILNPFLLKNLRKRNIIV